MDLAIDVGVSTRHLSFVETGRSRPSPELVLAIAHHLEVPLRERNGLLLAAGYAPRFSQMSLDDPAMEHVRASIQRMLDAHDPYPGVAIDRQWNVVHRQPAPQRADRRAARLACSVRRSTSTGCACIPTASPGARPTSPTGRRTCCSQLRRSIVLTGDPALEALLAEVPAYPNVRPDRPEPRRRPGSTSRRCWCRSAWRHELGELSLFTTLTTFGTPLDITIDELAVELFFPANDRTDQILRGDPAGSSPVRSFHPAGA